MSPKIDLVLWKKRKNSNFKISSYLFLYVKLLQSYVFPIAPLCKTVSAANFVVIFAEKL